jgi:DNA-binding transcriptional LysR family regulator
MLDHFSDILIFSEVARAGSVTEAARRLGIPKSTLSRRLIKFEDRLGGKLMLKSTRRIVLTEVGQEYLARCEQIARDLEKATALFEPVTREVKGTLRVTMPTDLGASFLSEFFAAFSRRYAALNLELNMSDVRIDILGERFDVALRAGALKYSSLVGRKIASVQFALYASPTYLASAGRPVSPSDIAAHRCILLEAHARPAQRLELTNGRKSAHAMMSGPIKSSTLGLAHALAVAGAGIAELPVQMCARETAEGTLVRVLPQWSPPKWDLHYLVPDRKLLPSKTRAFVDALAAYCADRF